MKKEDINNLIREYLTLRKQIDHLREELKVIRNDFAKTVDLGCAGRQGKPPPGRAAGLRRRFEGVEGLLYGYRSRDFIRSVIPCVLDLEGEYGKDKYYHNLLTSLISIVRHFDEFDADRKKYGNLIVLPDEEVE